MIFTLEALNARQGDAFLLHYGEKKSLKHILIDGGPTAAYNEVLKKRLAELKPAGGHGTPRLEMIMVSHLDSDHICGICSMAEEMIRAHTSHRALPYDVSSIWLNTFEKKILAKVKEITAALEGAQAGMHETEVTYPVTKKLPIGPSAAAFLTSVKDGITMTNYAHKLGFSVNYPFDDFVAAPENGEAVVEIDQRYGLKFNVISPDQCMIDNLENEWRAICVEITNAKAKNRMKEAEIIAAGYIDNSIYNLSSIVVLAEAGGKKMLLTGDARGDIVVEGLKRAHLLKNGKLHVGLLKLPHHGSKRSVSPEFFQTISADNYVISANGTEGHPDTETLEWLIKSRGSAERYNIYFTNCDKRLIYFLEKMKNKNFNVISRKQSEPSVQIKLGE